MSTHNIIFVINLENFPKISLNICFLERVEEFHRNSKKQAMGVKSLKLYCIRNQHGYTNLVHFDW